MKTSIHNKTQVPITFKNVWHYFLYWLVFKMIASGKFTNIGRFKPGDKVKYNWRAKVYIGHIHSQEKGVLTFQRVCDWSTSGSNCYYVDSKGEVSGCDVFWLTKI